MGPIGFFGGVSHITSSSTFTGKMGAEWGRTPPAFPGLPTPCPGIGHS